ncbi:hypothetical protein [uncultured Aquimonas sp.]|uniref:hypothetical protein n=1 Tax=uncultured Aquimonas sp. TaxID=385483 RepID=UPI0026252B59|nr:hypothetical protein [uncultured Aquimonas sp.]
MERTKHLLGDVLLSTLRPLVRAANQRTRFINPKGEGMKNRSTWGVLCGTVCALAMAQAAQAEITVVQSVAEFDAVVSGIAVDDYAGFSVTGSTPSPLTRGIPPYAYTANATTPEGAQTNFFGAGTTADPFLSLNTATDLIRFDGFAPAINAIGGQFFGSNISGLYTAGDIIIEVVDSLGDTETLTLLGPQQTTFRGFVSNGTITSLTVRSVQPAGGFLWPTVDNLRAGVVNLAPEIFLDGFETPPPPTR